MANKPQEFPGQETWLIHQHWKPFVSRALTPNCDDVSHNSDRLINSFYESLVRGTFMNITKSIHASLIVSLFPKPSSLYVRLHSIWHSEFVWRLSTNIKEFSHAMNFLNQFYWNLCFFLIQISENNIVSQNLGFFENSRDIAS